MLILYDPKRRVISRLSVSITQKTRKHWSYKVHEPIDKIVDVIYHTKPRFTIVSVVDHLFVYNYYVSNTGILLKFKRNPKTILEASFSRLMKEIDKALKPFIKVQEIMNISHHINTNVSSVHMKIQSFQNYDDLYVHFIIYHSDDGKTKAVRSKYIIANYFACYSFSSISQDSTGGYEICVYEYGTYNDNNNRYDFYSIDL